MKHPSMLDDAPHHLAHGHDKSPIVVVGFAGGGGSTIGIEAAGIRVDVAINHDPEAVAMHEANHPHIQHFCQSIWQVHPHEVMPGRPVALAWFSPDCKHFSKAKGGKPRDKNIRDLAWVVVAWARTRRPTVIMLENVEEFVDWGPLTDDGEPDKGRKGETFRQFCAEFRKLGYRIDFRMIRACDYGAPTIRKRLYMVMRCDGLPIVWPEPTHGTGLLPYRTAANIIDWSIPCPSIFERERPLREATCRRIAAGIMRYVVNAARPFIVPVTNSGWNPSRTWSADEPLRTITTAKGGEMAVVAPTLIQTGYGERQGQAPRALNIHQPLGTAVAGGVKHALVAAFIEKFSENSRGTPMDEPLHTVMAGAPRHGVVLAHLDQANGGPRNGNLAGRDVAEPVSTILASGSHQRLVASHLVKLRGTCKDGQPTDEPMPTVTAGGYHVGEVRAFLMKYYGTGGQLQGADESLHTVPTKDRFALVTVEGETYAIADIGMRMLTPRELARAQGFPDSYILDPVVNGRPLPKTAQVRMIGNSVCPDVAAALVRANAPASLNVQQVAA